MIQFDPEFDEDIPDDSIWLRMAGCVLLGLFGLGLIALVIVTWP